MTTTIICQYSGVQFEARSARTKNHPVVAEFLTRANRDGRYGETIEAMQSARRAGGYTTAEQFVTLVAERLNATDQRRQAAAAASEQAYQDMTRRLRDRDEQLQRAGFYWDGDWGMDTYDETEEPSGRPPTHWYLIAPDKRQITEEQAMAIVSGATTLEAVRAAEAQWRREEAGQD